MKGLGKKREKEKRGGRGSQKEGGRETPDLELSKINLYSTILHSRKENKKLDK